MINIGASTKYKTSQNITTWGSCVIGNELFVSSYSTSNIIEVYNLDTNLFVRKIVTPFYYSYAIGTDGVDLYVSSTVITKIDKNTGAKISDIRSFTNLYYSSFAIDLKNDRIYYGEYNDVITIRKFSDGSLIKSYTLPDNYTSGVTLINNKYILVTTYGSDKIYMAEIINNNVDNLTFTQVYNASSLILNASYYNDNLYLTTYSTDILKAPISGIQLAYYKLLIQDGSNIDNIVDNDGLTIRDVLPYTLNTFDTYGMANLSKINNNVISKIQNQKYKISLMKKK